MIVEPIEDISLNEGFRSVAVDISGVFIDPDKDELSYICSSGDTSIITVYMDETNLIIREVGIGSTTISLCADDGEFQTCQTININIEAVNFPPVIDCGEDTDISFVEGFGTYSFVDLCTYFSDEENDPLTFSASSSNEAVATVGFETCDLVVTEVGLGVTTIQFCANDGHSSTCCTFQFFVIEENEIVLMYEGSVLTSEDSVKICSDAANITIDVQSNAEWSFVTYSDWILPEIIDNATLSISCPENTTGEWRMGLVKVIDDQDHEASFYVYQSKDCIPDLVEEYLPENINYYPNPVKDVLNIEASDLDGSIVYSIIDLNGRVLLEGSLISIDGGVIKIDMSIIKEGFYYIRLSDQQGEKIDLPVIRN